MKNLWEKHPSAADGSGTDVLDFFPEETKSKVSGFKPRIAAFDRAEGAKEGTKIILDRGFTASETVSGRSILRFQETAAVRALEPLYWGNQTPIRKILSADPAQI